MVMKKKEKKKKKIYIYIYICIYNLQQQMETNFKKLLTGAYVMPR